jgi:biopolymer transport protein TolR
MGMSVGGGYHQKAEMNVTPLIDVLLVLIIIFLLVLPKVPVGLKADAPPQADGKPAAPREDIILTVFRDETVQLNQDPAIAMKDLDARLRVVFASTTNHVIFVRGSKDLEFHYIAEVIDIAKGVGLNRVALMPQQ